MIEKAPFLPQSIDKDSVLQNTSRLFKDSVDDSKFENYILNAKELKSRDLKWLSDF